MLKLKPIVNVGAVSASLLASLLASPLAVSATDQEIEALKARIQALESTPTWSSTDYGVEEDPLAIHGFVNAGVSSANTDAAGPVSGGIIDDLNHQAHQSFGLQVSYQLDNKTDVVAQMLGRAYQDNMNVRMNWAYIGRTLLQDKGPLSDLKLRVGRAPADIYMISEYYDVGYAYPWVTPPREAYDLLGGIPYDGVDLAANFALPANWNMQIKGFVGEVNVEPQAGRTSETDLENVRGVNMLFERDAWRVRLGYAQADVQYDVCCGDVAGFDTLSGGYNELEAGYAELVGGIQSINPAYTPSFTATPITDTADNLSGSFSGVGASYDNGTWLVMGEYTFQRWDTYNPDYDRAYLTVGRRFGEWMPYISAAESKVEDDSESQAFADQIAKMKANLSDAQIQASVDGAKATAESGKATAEAAIAAGESVIALYAAGDEVTAELTCDGIAGAPPGTITDNTQCLAIASGAISEGQDGVAQADEGLEDISELEAGLAAFDANADLLSSSFNSLSSPQKTYSVGLRYDFAPGATAKLQVDKVTGFENTRGTLENAYVSHFAIQAAF